MEFFLNNLESGRDSSTEIYMEELLGLIAQTLRDLHVYTHRVSL
jgi:hypothetical protein